MSNIGSLPRQNNVFFGNYVKASRQLQTNLITDYDGTGAPLNLKNNIATTNFGVDTAGRDGGMCVRRFQNPNDVGAGDVVSDTPQETGTNQSNTGLTTAQLALDAGASVTDDFYINWYIRITSGLHLDQVRKISDYVGATKVINITSNWTPIDITGTVSTTATSTTVAGVGTAFTTELAVGDSINIAGEILEIASITNDTTLDAVSPYENTNSGVTCALLNPAGGLSTYDLFNHVYTCVFWDESAKSWVLSFTPDPATGDTLTITDFADLTAGTITSNGGTVGDVIGPASSTDNAVVRFDTTTGKLIQNSTVIIDDSGQFSGPTLTTDADNILLGGSAGSSLTTGTNNTFIGISAGQNITTESDNTFIGNESGVAAVLSSDNTCIGSGSGNSMSANGCVLIGKDAGNGNTTNNRLMIDNTTTNQPLIDGRFDANTIQFNGTVTLGTIGTPVTHRIESSTGASIDTTTTPSTARFTINIGGTNYDIPLY